MVCIYVYGLYLGVSPVFNSHVFWCSEFASQLPHDGGAFYTTDTIESSRPHYAASWPPVLHAAALWLNACGFDSRPSSVSVVPNNNNNGKSGDSASDRFHLLFGEW